MYVCIGCKQPTHIHTHTHTHIFHRGQDINAIEEISPSETDVLEYRGCVVTTGTQAERGKTE